MGAMKQTTQTPKTESPRNGVPGVVHLALEVADRGQSTAIAVLQDARTELRAAADHSLELAEKLTAGALRFARNFVQKVDVASSDALTGAQRALSNAVKTARETTAARVTDEPSAPASISKRATA